MGAETDPNMTHAEDIAIQALSFIAGRPEELARFISLSGIDPSDIRRLAGDTAFLGGVLDFLLQDEPLLLSFASENGLSPQTVVALRQNLESGPKPLDSGLT